jgi:hypothetical protein
MGIITYASGATPRGMRPDQGSCVVGIGLRSGFWTATLWLAGIMAASAVPMSGDRRSVQPGAFPATGHVRCAGGSGTAQLVGSTQVIVTAGHVLIGRGGGGCSISFVMNGAKVSVPIDLSQMRVGAGDPMSAPAAQDWAVARLARPIPGVRPFSTATAVPGQQVTLVSARTLGVGSGPVTEQCRIRGTTGRSAELAIDCSAQPGDSGAALVTSDGRVAAIYVGYRSENPHRSAAFSDKHYNFALPITGRLGAAIRELSR